MPGMGSCRLRTRVARGTTASLNRAAGRHDQYSAAFDRRPAICPDEPALLVLPTSPRARTTAARNGRTPVLAEVDHPRQRAPGEVLNLLGHAARPSRLHARGPLSAVRSVHIPTTSRLLKHRPPAVG